MKNLDVITFGEILVDFTYAGKNSDGKKTYEFNAGGAPANCICAASKLGAKGAFFGMTGTDSFGADLKETLKELNVDVSCLKTCESQHTTLAFVNLDEKGERTFSFCRNPGADTQFSSSDLNLNMLKETKIFHVGSLSLTNEPSRSATYDAIKCVKEAGGLISYDPNWRENLWKGNKEAFTLIKSIFSLADIVKISQEEMCVIFEKELSIEECKNILLEQGVSLVMITLGKDGVYYAMNTKSLKSEGTVPTPKVEVVDTTGAGDSFTGGMLYHMTRRESPLECTEEELKNDLKFANAVASLCVTKRGAIPALPSLSQVEELLSRE